MYHKQEPDPAVYLVAGETLGPVVKPAPDRDTLRVAPQGQVRKFETGASRDVDTNKLDYEAFFSPEVLERRAQFMHEHRFLPDGSMRPGDNWKKGIPREAYMKSLARHYMDVWKEYKGIKTAEGVEEAICAAMFNLEGMLYEILKGKKNGNG